MARRGLSLSQVHGLIGCRTADTRVVNSYNCFVREAPQAWQDTARKNVRTLHHRGWGTFRVAGPDLTRPSRMRCGGHPQRNPTP